MSNRQAVVDHIDAASIRKTVISSLRSSIVVLIVFSAIAVSVNAIWGSTEKINGYLLVLSFLAAAVISPRVWTSVKKLPLIIAAILLGMVWLLDITHYSFFSLSIFDVAIATVGSWLIRRLASGIPAPQSGALTDAGNAKSQTLIRSTQQFEQDLGLELVRSRRHERTFCLAIIKFDEPVRNIVIHEVAKLDRILRDSVRSIDQMYLGSDSSELLLICPETNAMGFGALTDRLLLRLANILPVISSVGWAEFPTECLTSKDLIAVARKKSVQSDQKEHLDSADVAQAGENHNQMDPVSGQ